MPQWMRLCGKDELPSGSMKALEHRNGKLLVANVEGNLYAISALCTHEEADLSVGMLMENRVTCPLHLSQFDITSGEALEPPATDPLQTFKVKIDDGAIFVEVD